jgi:hypothetical protein
VSRPLKEGSKGYCEHCGFRIEVKNIRTGKEFSGPFWRLAWVHVRENSYELHCHWIASPKKHDKKGLDAS